MFQTVAWGLIEGISGNALNSRGIAATARTGVGTYTLTLDGILVDNDEMMLTFTTNAGAQFTAQMSGGSDGVKTVRTFDAAGAPGDVNFYFKLEKLNIL
jgi:hypothetical protein